MTNREECPICGWLSEIQGAMINDNFAYYVVCPRCGKYEVDQVTRGYLNLEEFKSKSAVLSHAIRKMQRGDGFPSVDLVSIRRIMQNPLPKPLEQVNNLLLWIGDKTLGFGDEINLDGLMLQAEIGARTQDGIRVAIDYLTENKYVDSKKISTARGAPLYYRATLRMEGWKYYESLKHGNKTSRRAFIAMKFGDSDLDDIVEHCFRPAVKDTGFELFRLDDDPKAGLIDDRLRVEIRASRFLIADLTHENAGAYWEAGYAEGLGKPVIYTCEKKKFAEKKTHFDTNHHLTVLWDKDDLGKTSSDLKNTIRATLPEEA